MLAVGGALPLAIVCLAMSRAGVFDKFWFWTVSYASEYATGIPLSRGVWRLASALWELIKGLPLVWGAAALGIAALFVDQRWRSARAFVLALAGFSLLGTCPSLHFWPHAFVFVAPAVALLATLGFDWGVRLVGRASSIHADREIPLVAVVVGLAVVLVSTLPQREYFYWASPDRISRLTYGHSPIPEAREIARWLSEHSREQGPILVIGSEPQIYFYTGRRAASPHVYMYPLMEVQPFALEMQKELAAQVEEARPEWIVFERVPIAWTKYPDSENWMFGWAESFLNRDYELAGLIDIGDDSTEYLWEANAQGREPRYSDWLTVYRRKGEPGDVKR